MMSKRIPVAALVLLAGCEPGQIGQGRPPVLVGETGAGQGVYEFRITRNSALGVAPVSEAAIAGRAQRICPGGYEELSRTGAVTRRVSGVIYVDVDVTIICT